MRSRDRVVGGGGGVGARLRLVARSRHYTGRHFLSDPGVERCGVSALASGFFNCNSAVAEPGIRRTGWGGGEGCVPRIVARILSYF